MPQIRLSATSIQRFKACPMRWWYADVLGLRPAAEDSVSLRVGSNWHEIMDTYRTVETEHGAEAATVACLELIAKRYEFCPGFTTPDEWATERETLVALFVGYVWYWQDDRIETIATELGFWFPLHEPTMGLPCRQDQVVRLGHIDALITKDERLMQREYKTTSSDVGAASPYWDRLRLNTQVSMYDLALRDGIAAGSFDIELPDLPIGGCLYDVTRRPSIAPKLMSQADTKAFFATKTYYEEAFEIEGTPEDGLLVDGWPVGEIKEGARADTWAIRETPGMFRARLLDDIYARPETYYARREIARTNKQREEFRRELYAVYRAMRHALETGHVFRCEDRCNDFGGCDYRDTICHVGNAPDPNTGAVPAGLKRIFTPLTMGDSDAPETATD